MKILQFHGKDFTTATLPNGEILAVYRQRNTKKVGLWAPHNGLVHCPGKTVPITPDTREFWKEPKHPGYGSRNLQITCKDLDNLRLPEGRKVGPQEVNAQLGELGLDLNERLKQIDLMLMATDRPTIMDAARSFEKKKEAAARPPGSSIGQKSKPQSMLLQMLELAKDRIIDGLRTPKVGRKLATVALVILASTTQAKSTGFEEEIRSAQQTISQMTGQQLKDMLVSVPEADRIALVGLLPKGILPPFVPKEIAAKSISLVPPENLKKGFDKMTGDQLVEASTKTEEKNVKMLLDLVNNTNASLQKTKNNTLAMAGR